MQICILCANNAIKLYEAMFKLSTFNIKKSMSSDLYVMNTMVGKVLLSNSIISWTFYTGFPCLVLIKILYLFLKFCRFKIWFFS